MSPAPSCEPFVMQTERLHLRALHTDDADLLQRLYDDPRVTRFIGAERLTPVVIGQQVEKFAGVWAERGFGQSIVNDRATGQVIGRVGLHPWPEWGEVELGWVLRASSQGTGRATEAARAWLDWAAIALPAAYLTAVIHPDNAPSIRLAERLGFVLDRFDETPWSPAVVYRKDLT